LLTAKKTATFGNRVLAPAAINSENLLSHRLGLVSRMVEIFQSKLLFEPNSICRGFSIAALDFHGFMNLIGNLHYSLGIPFLPEFDDDIQNSYSQFCARISQEGGNSLFRIPKRSYSYA
jgi:hypothetical protein